MPAKCIDRSAAGVRVDEVGGGLYSSPTDV